MENSRVVVDTSVIIDFLRKKNKSKSILWTLQDNNLCFMSVITLFELCAGAKSQEHYDDINKIKKWINPLDFNDKISELSGKIY